MKVNLCICPTGSNLIPPRTTPKIPRAHTSSLQADIQNSTGDLLLWSHPASGARALCR